MTNNKEKIPSQFSVWYAKIQIKKSGGYTKH